MKKKVKSIFIIGLCSVLAMSNMTTLFASGAEVNEVTETEEYSIPEIQTMSAQEMHDYKMWLFENQEHVEEIAPSTPQMIRRRTGANNYSYSGQCGDEVSFFYDEQFKTLNIYGTGKMWNLNDTDYTQYPWNGYKNEIENINIGSEVTFISNSAFSGFSSLESVYVPTSVEEIGVYAFAFCYNLESISIHAKLINQCAFFGCNSLTVVDINSVEDIAWRAFSGCSSLTSITIPASIDVLWQPFYNCTSLESISVAEDNEFFTSIDGVLFDKDVTTLRYYPSNKSGSTYQVPLTVENIDTYAFAYSRNLTNPLIPSGCKLGDSIFENSYFINHWYENNSAYRFHSNNGYYYLIINGVLLGVKTDDGTPITTLDFTNSIHNSTGSRMVNKVDLENPDEYASVTNVVSDYWVDIQYNCLRKTQWYSNNDLNVIYNDSNPDMASYKLLYSYHGNDVSLNAESFTHIGAKAFSNWRVEENNESVAVDIYLSSNNNSLNSDSLLGVNIGNVYVDSTPVDINYIKIPSEQKDSVGAMAIDGYDETFQYNLALATAKNWDYFDKLASEYCNTILDDLNINQYKTRGQKIKVVYDWMHENCKYDWWHIKDDNGDKTYNGQNYSVFYSLTYRKSAHLLTGYGVCASYADLFNCFMKELDIPSIYVVNSGIDIEDVHGNHAWNLVEVDGDNHIWYYMCVTNYFFLNGQNNFTNDIFVGYRNSDKDNYDYINQLFPSNGYSNDTNTISDSDFEPIIEKQIVLNNAIGNTGEASISCSNSIFDIVNENNNSVCYYLFGEKSLFNGLTVKVGEETIYTFNNADELSFYNPITGRCNAGNGNVLNYIIENNEGVIEVTLFDSSSGYVVIDDHANIVDHYIVETLYGEKYYETSAFLSLSEPISVRFYDSNNVLINSVTSTNFNEVTGISMVNDAAYKIVSSYKNEMPVITLSTYVMGDVNMNGYLDEEDSKTLMRYIISYYNFIQTGSTGNLNLGDGNITVNGDISANGIFTIEALNANINGQLSASSFVNNIQGNLNMNKPMNNITITDEYVKAAFTDDRMNSMFFASNNTNVLSSDYIVDETNITVSNNTSVDGEVSLNGNVNINSNLKADGDINIVGNVQNTINGVIYSKNGDITLDSNNINFNGFIYAPNGTVTLTGSTITIKGTIIAENLVIDGDTVNFNVAAIDEGHLGGEGYGDISLTPFQIMIGDVNYDSNINISDVVIINRRRYESA